MYRVFVQEAERAAKSPGTRKEIQDCWPYAKSMGMVGIMDAWSESYSSVARADGESAKILACRTCKVQMITMPLDGRKAPLSPFAGCLQCRHRPNGRGDTLFHRYQSFSVNIRNHTRYI